MTISRLIRLTVDQRDAEKLRSAKVKTYAFSQMTSMMRPVRVLQKHWKLTFIAVCSLSIAMALGVLSLA